MIIEITAQAYAGANKAGQERKEQFNTLDANSLMYGATSMAEVQLRFLDFWNGHFANYVRGNGRESVAIVASERLGATSDIVLAIEHGEEGESVNDVVQRLDSADQQGESTWDRVYRLAHELRRELAELDEDATDADSALLETMVAYLRSTDWIIQDRQDRQLRAGWGNEGL